MPDEHSLRDDAERLADRIIAAFDDNGFELADGWIERARGDAITILKGELDARDAALRDARAEIENLQADQDMAGTMIRRLREQAVKLREHSAAAERARIVAWLRTKSSAISNYGQFFANAIERGDHARPEPAKADGGIASGLSPELADLLRKAQSVYDAMTPEQQAAHDAAQRESFVRGNIELDRMERAVGMTRRIAPRSRPA